MIDPLEEARALELDERLRSRVRGRWPADRLLRAASEAGHNALGFTGAGLIMPGAWADLVSVQLDSVRTAGAERAHPETMPSTPPPPQSPAEAGRFPAAHLRDFRLTTLE